MDNELSNQYFSIIPDLQLIEQPFDYNSLGEQLSVRDLQTEFQLLRALTQTKKHKQRLRLSTGPEHKLNRYPEQSIYEHSRVRLGEQYVNGNIIPSGFDTMVLAQAPMETTLDHFDDMIQSLGITCVVMVCGWVEGGKSRCYEYLHGWEVLEQVQKGELTKRKVKVRGRVIQHLHYKGWPDKSTPPDKTTLHPLLTATLPHSHVLIHCSAGLGRSGVLATILSILTQTQHNNHISIFHQVRKLRQHRYGAVQNSQQYRFVYEFLHEYLNNQ